MEEEKCFDLKNISLAYNNVDMLGFKIKKRRKKSQKRLTITNINDIFNNVTEKNGRLAQLVRAPALQAGGHRFESYSAHHFIFLPT